MQIAGCGIVGLSIRRCSGSSFALLFHLLKDFSLSSVRKQTGPWLMFHNSCTCFPIFLTVLLHFPVIYPLLVGTLGQCIRIFTHWPQCYRRFEMHSVFYKALEKQQFTQHTGDIPVEHTSLQRSRCYLNNCANDYLLLQLWAVTKLGWGSLTSLAVLEGV